MNISGRDRLENFAKSLETAFGGAVTAGISAGLLRLSIGPKMALINSCGELEGESFAGPRGLDVGVYPDCGVVASAGAPIVT